ncbi:hypothetical protein C8F04DRAFT_1273152 [Mycena alexandri]|uniref:Secreted protein n=1 Tax=Mycena alexandri TaxID=1745969 RepID=A0AAD6S7A3_9AGAR|nr:hypothetical protein C8F04DRAFT_1273152 [Mycena alexandri]
MHRQSLRKTLPLWLLGLGHCSPPPCSLPCWYTVLPSYATPAYTSPEIPLPHVHCISFPLNFPPPPRPLRRETADLSSRSRLVQTTMAFAPAKQRVSKSKTSSARSKIGRHHLANRTAFETPTRASQLSKAL